MNQNGVLSSLIFYVCIGYHSINRTMSSEKAEYIHKTRFVHNVYIKRHFGLVQMDKLIGTHIDILIIN